DRAKRTEAITPPMPSAGVVAYEWFLLSAPRGGQDRDDLVRAKPLLLREAVKEAVAGGSRNCSPRNRGHGRPPDAPEKHSPMHGASERQATDGRSGRGLRQKGRRAEQVSAR